MQVYVHFCTHVCTQALSSGHDRLMLARLVLRMLEGTSSDTAPKMKRASSLQKDFSRQAGAVLHNVDRLLRIDKQVRSMLRPKEGLRLEEVRLLVEAWQESIAKEAIERMILRRVIRRRARRLAQIRAAERLQLLAGRNMHLRHVGRAEPGLLPTGPSPRPSPRPPPRPSPRPPPASSKT